MKTVNGFIINFFTIVTMLLSSADRAVAQQMKYENKLATTAISASVNDKSRSTGFYHPYVYPHVGVSVKNLPSGSYQFSWGPSRYYYAEGIFYQAYANGSYKIAAPPVGAEVPSLPFNADIITIDGNPYYQYKGIYYESTFHDDGGLAYKVVGQNGVFHPNASKDPTLPLIGDMINTLPAGSRILKLGRNTYWVTPDQIYLEKVDDEKSTRFRVVAIAQADPDQSA